MQRNGPYLSEHIFQGKMIQKQFPRIHQPLVFGALNIKKIIIIIIMTMSRARRNLFIVKKKMRKRKENLRRESTTPRNINEDEITETTTGINAS